jgi:hypothetical protein
LTNLGIGEAFVSVLNEKGIPTPLAHTLMRPPQSRMDILSPSEIDHFINNSSLVRKYNQEINRESAYEILTEKIQEAAEAAPPPQDSTASQSRRPVKEEKGMIEKVIDNPLARQVGRTVARELTRGLLGVLGLGGGRSSSRKKTGWF